MMPGLSDAQLQIKLVTATKLLDRLPPSADKLVRRLELIGAILSKVEQPHAKSMKKYLSPLIKALVMDDLLKQTDVDVKVGVGSCISEITRITAPNFPYNKNKMKEVFQLFVSSFENLSEVTTRSYVKRVNILKNVAEVRSCLLMLDLQCDQMIIEMFQHFLKAIRDYHADVILKSMETIMTLVLKDSERISPELLAPILATLKRNNEAAIPIAKKLAERVIQNSAHKLKPYLRRAVKSLNTSLDDYSEVVSCVCGATLKMSNKRKPTPGVATPKRSNKRKPTPDIATPKRSNKRKPTPNIETPKTSNKRKRTPDMKMKKKGNANSETSSKRQKVEGSPKSKPIDTAPEFGSKSKDDDKAEFGGKGHVDIGEASSISDEVARILCQLSSGRIRMTRSISSKVREIDLVKEKTNEKTGECEEVVSKNDDACANDQTEKTADASNKTEHRSSLRKDDGKKRGRAKPTSECEEVVSKNDDACANDPTEKTADASNKTEHRSSLRKDDVKKRGRAKPVSKNDDACANDPTEKTADASNKTEHRSSLRKDDVKKRGRAKPVSKNDDACANDPTEKTVDASNKTEHRSSLRKDGGKKRGRAKPTSEKDVRKSSASEDLGKFSGEASLTEDIHFLPQVMENKNSGTSETTDVSKNDDACANDQTEKTADASNKTVHRSLLRKDVGKKRGRALPTSEKDVRKSSASEDLGKFSGEASLNKDIPSLPQVVENKNSGTSETTVMAAVEILNNVSEIGPGSKPTSEEDVRKSSASEDLGKFSGEASLNKDIPSLPLVMENKNSGTSETTVMAAVEILNNLPGIGPGSKPTSEKDVPKSSASEDLGKNSGEASLNEDIHLLPQVMANKNSGTSETTVMAAVEILNNLPGIGPGSKPTSEKDVRRQSSASEDVGKICGEASLNKDIPSLPQVVENKNSGTSETTVMAAVEILNNVSEIGPGSKPTSEKDVPISSASEDLGKNCVEASLNEDIPLLPQVVENKNSGSSESTVKAAMEILNSLLGIGPGSKPTSETDVRKSSASEDLGKICGEASLNEDIHLLPQVVENKNSGTSETAVKAAMEILNSLLGIGPGKPTSETDVRKSSASEDVGKICGEASLNEDIHLLPQVVENKHSGTFETAVKAAMEILNSLLLGIGPGSKPTSEKDARKSSASEDLGKISGEASLNEDIHLLPQVMQNKNSGTSETTVKAALEILSNVPGIVPGSELWNHACTLLTQKDTRELFVFLASNEIRLSWLEFSYDSYKSNK